jgi:hypothetical protein
MSALWATIDPHADCGSLVADGWVNIVDQRT